MPGQIPSLRIFSSSVPFSTMKLGASVESSRGVSIFSKVFPFKLKYLALSRNGALNQGFGARRFSSSSFRGRNGGGRSSSSVENSGFSRSRGGVDRGGRGGEFQGGSFGGRVGQAKSLIEDEDELSDWVSDLKPDSFRVGLTSESDDDSGRGQRGQSSDRGRDSGSMRSQRGGRDGYSERGGRGRFSDRNRRDGGRGRFSERSERGGGYSERSERGGGYSERSGRGGGYSERGGRGGFSDRGGRGGFSASKRRRDSDSDDFDVSERRSSRGGASASFSSRGSRGSMVSSGSRRRDFDSDGEQPPRRRENGSRGAVSSPRGGRDSDLSYGRSRGGGSIEKGKKRTPLISDEDEDDDSDSSFGDLLSDIGSELDSDEDEEELPVKRKGQGLRGAVPSSMKNKGRDSSSSRRTPQISSEDEEEDEDDDEDDDDDEDERPIPSFVDFLNGGDSEKENSRDANNVSSFQGTATKDAKQPKAKSSSGETDSYLSATRFDQCTISPLSLKGIKDAGYEKMTVVQEATLPVILKGKDVLAKARTGTGKTVAFLVPAIEAIVKSPPVDRDQKRPPINVLVMCPTRELASQAAAEATKLLKYHPSIGVQIVIGGTRLAQEQKRMQANPCQILVATPGRLKDHIENTPGFATRLMGVKVLVLDEADHLLDMGFRKDIEKIISAVPKQRQTLLFSATVPEDVRQICHIALKRDHEFINTVEEGSEETHSQVIQTHLVAPLDKHFSLLYALLRDHIADDVDYKVLVFCTTAMVTRLVADLLSELKLNVREIHSRKPQSYRTRVSDEFRKSKGLILVTSDVSARGVDYPDVTLVIQVGLPSDREQYIHRLGRTGRKGKEGLGVLLLAPWEDTFLSSIKDLPITKASAPLVDPETKKKVERAMSNVEMKNKEAAYQAWLGYYNSSKVVGRDKLRLVELANEFSRCMGLDNPPAIAKLVLGKMGLKNVPGLRVK